MRVRRQFHFEAAHRLPRHPGKCRELHGHSYGLVVTVDRPVDPGTGLAIDFLDLKEIVERQILHPLDHKNMNELMDNPTAEVMAAWIWERLAKTLPGLDEIELHETRDCSVIYRGN